MRTVGAVAVVERNEDLIFQETEMTLNIYLPLDNSDRATSNNRLSQEFIKCCNIKDNNYHNLVLAILTFPITTIEYVLEERNLDTPTSASSRLPVGLFTYHVENKEGSTGVEVSDTDSIPLGTIFRIWSSAT